MDRFRRRRKWLDSLFSIVLVSAMVLSMLLSTLPATAASLPSGKNAQRAAANGLVSTQAGSSGYQAASKRLAARSPALGQQETPPVVDFGGAPADAPIAGLDQWRTANGEGSIQAAAASAAVVGTKKAVVLRVYFNDYAANSRYTKAEVESMFDELDQLWQDTSYSKIDIAHEVSDLFQLPDNRSAYIDDHATGDLSEGGKYYKVLSDAVDNAPGTVDWSNVDAVFVLMAETDPAQFHRGQANKCTLPVGTSGADKLVGCAIFSENPSETDRQVWGRWAHEMGHAFQEGGPAHPSNYNSEFELMDSNYPGQTGVFEKQEHVAFPGWMPSAKYVNVTAANGGESICLWAEEYDPTSQPNPQAIKAKITGSLYYLISVRRRVLGDDLNGDFANGIPDEGVLIERVSEGSDPWVTVKGKGGNRNVLWKAGDQYDGGSDGIYILIEKNPDADNYCVTVRYDDRSYQPDVMLDPWTSPPGNTWETTDIWVDSPVNGYDTYRYGFWNDLSGNAVPQGNGDDPAVGLVNRLYARVRNVGSSPATDVVVRWQITDPPGVGIAGANGWADIGSVDKNDFPGLASIAPGDFVDVYVEWTPNFSLTEEQVTAGRFHFHTCVRVKLDPVAGETVLGNQDGDREQENINTFQAVADDPEPGFKDVIRLHNDALTNPKGFTLSYESDLPASWDVDVNGGQFSLLLAPNEVREIPVTIVPNGPAVVGSVYAVDVQASSLRLLVNDMDPDDQHPEFQSLGGVRVESRVLKRPQIQCEASDQGEILVKGQMSGHEEFYNEKRPPQILIQGVDAKRNFLRQAQRVVPVNSDGSFEGDIYASNDAIQEVVCLFAGTTELASASSGYVPVQDPNSPTPTPTITPTATPPASCQELYHENQIPHRTLIDFDDLADAAVIGDHYQAKYGVRFEDAANTRVITYSNRQSDPTQARSAPNVATNSAISPNTSYNVPLVIKFDSPQAHVGFYMGNGEDQNLTGTLVGYDTDGNVVCRVRNAPVPEQYNEFIGMYDPAGRIAMVHLDYGESYLSESIDDLYFSADRAEPQPVEPTPTPPLERPQQPIFNRETGVTIEIGQSTNQLFGAKVGFPSAQMWNVTGPDKQIYTQVAVPGVDQRNGAPGQPDVPVLHRLVAVPRGAKVQLRNVETAVQDPQSLLLYPVQPEPVDGDPAQEAHPGDPPHKQPPGDEVFGDPPFAFDEEAYASAEYFPAEPVSVHTVGRMRDLDLVQVDIAAGQYLPAKQQLVLFASVQFELVFEGGEGFFLPQRVLNPFEDGTAAYSVVLNREAIYEYIDDIRLPELFCLGNELLIITDPAFRSAADSLHDWKEAKGISTLVVETGNDPGDAGTTNTEIQSYIRGRYNDCLIRPSYVDLIGDAEYIPPFYRSTSFSDSAGTDLDYSLMDDSDTLPDLAVGRIPVDTLAQAETVVDKIVNYEQSPPFTLDFYRDMSFASYFQCCQADAADGTAQRAYVETSEFVRDGLSGYTVERIYTTNAGTETPSYYYNGAALPTDLGPGSGFTWDGDTADIVNAFNDGRSLIYHRDHGWSGGWSHPAFNTGDLGDLTNGDLTPVVYSVNCSTGYFDNETDGSGASGDYFAEQLLRLADGGAVGVIAATRVSPTWANNALTRGLFDATWPQVLPSDGDSTSIRRLGDILNYGKAYMAGQVGVSQTAGSVSSSSADTDYVLFHVFGDATMELWTHNPYIIPLPDLVIPQRVRPKIWRLIYPVEGAVITALQNGKPLGRATVVDGEATMRFIADVDPDQKIDFSATHPQGIPTRLRVERASGQVSAEEGGSVANEDGSFEIEFPARAVDGVVQISYTNIVSPTQDVPSEQRPLRSFQMDAEDEQGNEVRQFNQTYTMRLHYDPAELVEKGIGPDSLQLAYWDEAQQAWVPVTIEVDDVNHVLVAHLDHFTEFVLTGREEPVAGHQLFLPLLNNQ